MDYLYFDMECADGNRVCSFGYVLTDERFNVLDKRDILINPECGFRLGRKGEEPWIKLAYPEEVFKCAPSFGKLYTQIKNILTAPDRVLIGHSISSDIGFLERACDRYQKPQLSLSVYDMQSVYALYARDSQMHSLEHIIEALGIDAAHLTEHKSCDDAEMTMLVAKALCSALGCGISGLIAKSAATIVSSDTLAIGRAVKELKKTYQVNKKAPSVCISDTIRPLSAQGRINLIAAVLRRGYGYTNNAQKCSYFVSNGGFGLKEQAYAELLAEQDSTALVRIKKITIEELADILKIQISDSGETSPESPARANISLKSAFISAKKKKKNVPKAE